MPRDRHLVLPGWTWATGGACAYVATFGLPWASNAGLLLLAVTGLLGAVSARSARRHGALLVPVLLFALSTLASMPTSVDPARSLRLSIPLVPGMLLFLLVDGYFERADVRRLYVTFVVVSLAMAGHLLWVALRAPFDGPTAWIDATATTLFVVPNDVAFFAVLLPLALALVLDDVPGLAALGAAAVAADVAVVATYRSRGMALVTLAVLAAWAVGTRRRAAAGAVALAVSVMVAVDAAWGGALLARVTEIWTTRIPIWAAALHMFGDAPVLGNGPRSFGVLFTEYSARVTLPDWLPSDMRFSPWAHDLYLETLAEQGVVGLAALLALLVGAGRAALRLARSPDDETRRLGAGVALGLGALCLAGIFELTLLRLWMVVVLFSLVGAVSALARDPAEPAARRSGGGR